MKDEYNRQISYMRLSVTDKCNFNCSYCKGDSFSTLTDVMSFDEMYEICKAFVKCGIDKIRLTGGEPLLREGIVDFCKRLSSIEGLNSLVMTTNGCLLKHYAKDLKRAGVSRLNISLDTLNKDKFNKLTGIDAFDDVIEGIYEAQECGFKNIKINVVLMGGINDDEIADFIELTKNNDFTIRFIELMPLGACSQWDKARFISSDLVLKTNENLERITFDGVSEIYRVNGYKGRIGLIRPMTNKFCDVCNRIRVTADGKIKPCLHSNDEYNIRGLSGLELQNAIKNAIASKPKSHNMNSFCLSNSTRYMNQIGG
ncbi:MAG: GTP 3',8-cyclase MoaA [Eubacteriales bacterium]|nr:GTP 3',8-cyclase MoaA [Eubacteriales bacterium]